MYMYVYVLLCEAGVKKGVYTHLTLLHSSMQLVACQCANQPHPIPFAAWLKPITQPLKPMLCKSRRYAHVPPPAKKWSTVWTQSREKVNSQPCKFDSWGSAQILDEKWTKQKTESTLWQAKYSVFIPCLCSHGMTPPSDNTHCMYHIQQQHVLLLVESAMRAQSDKS